MTFRFIYAKIASTSSGESPTNKKKKESSLVTATDNIDWAEQLLAKRGSAHALAAIVRGNDLWVRTKGEFFEEGWHGISELYEFVPDGAQPSDEHYNLELKVEGGAVYMVYAWADHYHQPTGPRYEDSQKALVDAERKLDAFTDPTDRPMKVMELLHWSHRAGRFDVLLD